MSIIAYCGLPGSGKSYSVVKHQILPALKLDRRVVTNVPLNMPEIRKLTESGEVIELPIERIQAEPHLIDEYATAGSVLVLDELWRLFPAGEKVNRVPESFRSLLAEHRHRVDASGRSMQIVFVTQSTNQIGAFARQLIEQTIITTKLTDVGLSGRYRVDVYRQAVAVERANPQNAIRQIQAQPYQAAIFKLYQSHTMGQSETVADVDESSMDRRGSFLRRPLFILGPIFIVVVLVTAFPFVWGLMTGSRSLVAEAPEPLVSPRTAQAGTAIPTQAVVRSASSPRAVPAYRLSGWLISADGDGVALIEDGPSLIRLNISQCHPAFADDYWCEYKGFRVDASGTRPLDPML